MLGEQQSRFLGSLSRVASGKVKICKVYKLYWKRKQNIIWVPQICFLHLATSKSMIDSVCSISVETTQMAGSYLKQKHEVPNPLKQMAYISAISCSTPTTPGHLLLHIRFQGFPNVQGSGFSSLRNGWKNYLKDSWCLPWMELHGLKIYCLC